MTQQQPPVMRVFHGPGFDCGVQGCAHEHSASWSHTSAVLAPALRNPVTGGTSWFHGASFDPNDDAPRDGARHNLTSPHLPAPGGEQHDPGGTVRPPEEHSPDYGGFETGERIGHHWNTDLGSHFSSLQSVAKGFASGQYNSSGGENARVLHAGLHMANPKRYADETEMAHHAIRWAHENGHKFLGSEAEEGDHERFIDGEFGFEDGEDGDGPIGAHLDHLHEHTSPQIRSQISEIHQHGPRGDGSRGQNLDAAERYLGLHPEREEVTEGFRKHLQDQGHDGIVYGNDHEGPQGHACAIAFPDTHVHQKKWDWQHPSKQHLNEPEQHSPEPMPGQGQLPLQMHSNLRVAVRLTPSVTREASVTVRQEQTDRGYRLRMDDQDTGERLGTLQYATEHGRLRFWAVQAANPSVARAMVEAANEAVRREASQYEPLPGGMFWRAHHPNQPFDAEHAESRSLGLTSDDKKGWSAFADPHDLHKYLHHMDWVDSPEVDWHERKIYGFPGTRTGLGIDGEDLVTPHHSRPAHSMGWDEFDRRLKVTPKSGGEGWDPSWAHHATVTAARHPLADSDGGPVDFHYVHNPESSTDHRTDQDFGQSVEPAGRYLNQRDGDFVPQGWESGTVHFNNPLRMSWGQGYGHPDNWKNRLSRHYDGKTGEELSWAVHRDGHDAIVTHDEYGPNETVDLTHLGRRTATVLTDWRPSQRLFAPTKGDVDPVLFDNTDRQMWPAVREEILSVTDGFFASHGYGVRPSWARVYLAGSQASEWWGNRDFDLLIGVNYPAYRQDRPQDGDLSDKEVDDRFNTQLRDDFNDDTWRPGFDPTHVWSRTGYVNHDSWVIAKIHPYAAYNVTDDEWAVNPIHEPVGHTFNDSEWYYFEGIAEQARTALSLTGSARTQACSRLWEFVHSDRSRAFGPGGTGAFDRGNALEKYLSQAPIDPHQTGSVPDEDSLMGALAAVRYGKEQKTASVEGWSDWREHESPYTGYRSETRSRSLGDARMKHTRSADGGSITVSHGDRIPGEMTYKLVDAPHADGSGTTPAVHVNWVEVDKKHRGKGWASAMYDAVREAHPDRTIPAASVLETPGRKVVKHYREKYPDVHTGRFDTEGNLHPTSGPGDPTYRPAMLQPKTAGANGDLPEGGEGHSIYRGLYLGALHNSTFHPAVDGKGIGHHEHTPVDHTDDDAVLQHVKRHADYYGVRGPREGVGPDDPGFDRVPLYGSHWTTNKSLAKQFSLDSSHGQQRVPRTPQRHTWGAVMQAHLTEPAENDRLRSNYGETQVRWPGRDKVTGVTMHLHHYDPDHPKGLRQDTYVRSIEVPKEHWKTAALTHEGERQAAASDWTVTREHSPSGGSKFGERYTLSAKDADGDEQGWVRYHEPKRKGSPIHVEEVHGHAPGAASHLLNHMEDLHPGASQTVFLGEKNRRNKNTPSHHDGEHGKPTDWDQHYDSLGGIHRGFSVRLDSHDARIVNSADHPAMQQVLPLMGKVDESNAGVHWTAGLQEAKNFAGKHQFDPRTDVPVILHAAKPARKDIETRPNELFRNGVFPHDHLEKEVPVRRGRDVALTGISWKPDAPHPDADEDGWLHHTFDQPITKRANLDDDRYQMDHRPPSGEDGGGMPIHDLTTKFPADVYTHPHYYSDMSEPSNGEAHRIINRVRNKPDAKVRIYRALPAEHAHMGIQPGDWVTTSKDYARQHGRHATDPQHDWPVVSASVPAKHLHTDGDDLREYGYNGDKAPGTSVAFKGGRHQEISQKADGTISRVQRRAESPIKGYSVDREPGSVEDSMAGRGAIKATAPDGSHAGHLRYDEDGIFSEHVEPEHEHVQDHLKKKMRSLMKGDPFLKFDPKTASEAAEHEESQ